MKDLKPVKGKKTDGGDRIHMHVDSDRMIGTVALMALGNTASFALDLGRNCTRVCLGNPTGAHKGCHHTPMWGQVNGDHCKCNRHGSFKRRDWHKIPCPTCRHIRLCSGDILLFNGHPDADIAHGALDTLVGAAAEPSGMPPWAQGVRVSVQYRQRIPA